MTAAARKTRPRGWPAGSCSREVSANHARGDEAGAEQKRQHDRGEERVDDAQDAGGDIEEAADHPQKEQAPAARMHADADLGRAGDQEQDAVERHRRDRRDEGEEQRREAEHDQEDAEGGDRRPFSAQALDRFAEAMREMSRRSTRSTLRFSRSEITAVLARAFELAEHLRRIFDHRHDAAVIEPGRPDDAEHAGDAMVAVP